MDRRKFLKYIGISLGVIIIPNKIILGSKINESLEDKLFQLYKEVYTKFQLNNEGVILIEGQSQKMYLVDGYDGFRIKYKYDISTGKYGFGNESGSGKTPTGIHIIKEKYGDNKPVGTIFGAGQYTGKIANIYTEKHASSGAFMTSRIMRLDGCEEKNESSHSRPIYIHGTSEEGLIGMPASSGCIRMRNKDVIELYDSVDYGTYVNIREP